jgi:hypothetical protein
MKLMGRRRFTTVAAVLAGLALAAMMPVPCACLPEPAASGEHACCVPPLGYQMADTGCCPTLTAAPQDAAVLVPLQDVSLPAVGVVAPAPVPGSLALAGRLSASAPVVPTPRTVRRL